MEGLGKRKGLLLQCGLFESEFFTSLLIPESLQITSKFVIFLNKKDHLVSIEEGIE